MSARPVGGESVERLQPVPDLEIFELDGLVTQLRKIQTAGIRVEGYLVIRDLRVGIRWVETNDARDSPRVVVSGVFRTR